MKRKAQDLHIGDIIKVAGTVCQIRGLQRNDRNGIVLNLRIKGVPYPSPYGEKSVKVRRRAHVTLVVPRKALLKVFS